MSTRFQSSTLRKARTNTYTVVQHQAQLLFNNRTQPLPMPQLLPSIPQYCFDFVDFDDLPMHLIDHLKLVYGSESTVIDGRPAVKRLLYIQNTRKQYLKVTLWGTLASEFDTDVISALPPLVMIVLTSTKILLLLTLRCVLINPKIPETDEYKARYKLKLRLEDEDDSTTAIIIGKAADNLFGVTCEELVNEQGEDDKHNIPLAIQKVKNKYCVWWIGYGIRDDFLVKDVYPQSEDDEQMAIENTTPQVQTPAKRAMQPRNSKEATLEELLNIEMKKKQKRGEGMSKGISK
ncbi:hypothetical protein ACLB2K_048157 [Fragaria x ananassa]